MRQRTWIITASALLILLVIVGGLIAHGGSGYTQKVDKGTTTQFPQPKGYINDFGQLLTDEQEKALTKIAAAFERRTTAQLAVVTIETISPFESIEPYATKLFNAWGIGQKDKNNGVLLLVVVKERKVRIEVGRGLEQILPNSRCKEILQTDVTPRLKEGAYYEAMKRGMESIIKEIEKQ
jgi:uncharacterized protein